MNKIILTNREVGSGYPHLEEHEDGTLLVVESNRMRIYISERFGYTELPVNKQHAAQSLAMGPLPGSRGIVMTKRQMVSIAYVNKATLQWMKRIIYHFGFGDTCSSRDTLWYRSFRMVLQYSELPLTVYVDGGLRSVETIYNLLYLCDRLKCEAIFGVRNWKQFIMKYNNEPVSMPGGAIRPGPTWNFEKVWSLAKHHIGEMK